MTSPITDIVTPPTEARGYEVNVPPSGVPDWGYFSTGNIGDPYEDVPALMWPNSSFTYHRMRTDAQIDALRKSVWLPLQGLNWKIGINGARDEVVNDISQQFNLPIQGDNDEFIQRGRKRFDHDAHLRMALLAPTCYGHMPFEMYGDILVSDKPVDNLKWQMRKLSPRMPMTIARFDVARDGGLNGITQYGMPYDLYRSKLPSSVFQTGIPIPITQLAMYTWELEAGNWQGRSMLRPLWKYWNLKDRMLRIDAIKNERFGAGIPTGTAPPGGDPADYQKMASAMRASEKGGVGLPNGSMIGIEGVKGTLPDTLASIRMYDEQMARSFLAMFMQLGQTETGSRALGATFLDFFTDSLKALVNWYQQITFHYVICDIVDWNWGEDEQAPTLVAEESDEKPLDASALAELCYRGALVVDAELENWIRSQFNMPEYKGAPPLPTRPGTTSQDAPPAAKAPAKARQRERITVRTKATKKAVKHAPRTRVRPALSSKAGSGDVLPSKATQALPRKARASSQTLNSDRVGHRDPSAVEAASKADFAKMQKAWESAVKKLVDEWHGVRATQIDDLIESITEAVKAGNEMGVALPEALIEGEDLLTTHMTTMATQALKDALAEAEAQGVKLPEVTISDVADQIAARAEAVANVMARDLASSAGRNAMLRYAVGVDPADVATGTRTALEALTDSYLNDQLGGAITAAQNMARTTVMAGGPDGMRIYASELLDENTCDECAAEDETEFADIVAATVDYPSGGYSECLGGPRCRGTLVAVYGEGQD